MGTLDRYIARQFTLNAIALLVLLCTFVVLTSVSLNFDDFLEAAKGASSQGNANPGSAHRVLTALLLVIDIWGPRLVQLFVFVNGFVLVGAMGFTLAQLVKHRELVAMLAGGVPLWRAMRPIGIVALGFIGLQIAAQELLIPRLAPLLARSDRDAGKRDFAAFRVNLLADGQQRVLMARDFDPAEGGGTATGLYVLERDSAGRALSRLTADTARWDAAGERWILTNGQRRELRTDDPAANARAQVTPVRELRTSVSPTTLLSQRYRQFSATLSTRQLLDAASLPGLARDVREQLDRLVWGRWSGLLSILLSLIITMPFFLTREPRNMVAQSVKAAPVALGCLVAGVLGAAAPVPTDIMPVALAAFLPTLAMLPIAIAAATSVRS
ncbi:MAG: LptF/LptG family permease [Phycisphaerales bacterium]|jgi:lipopolysaccharide export LptBFGC system permease protein LptF|nr:LptF/LptG family permease [Phycisphaerales bacterium]